MIEGTWGFVYWGEGGLGIGIFVVKDGKVRGCDPLIAYEGEAVEDAKTGRVRMTVTMNVPAGVYLAGGAGAMDLPHSRRIALDLPPRFGDGETVDISALPGKTRAVFQQVPDERAHLADGFEIVSKKR